MADQSQMVMLRNLLIQQANLRKRTYLIGPKRRVNCAAISKATGISSSEINRILRLKPHRSKTKEWAPTGATVLGIMRWLGHTSLADFWDAAESAPMAPPPAPTKQTGRRRVEP
jgi:hypothetical protein